MYCRNPRTFARSQTDHIRQVVLALRIGIRECRKPSFEFRGRQYHDPGVDFPDELFFGRRILFFNNRSYATKLIAHDAPVTLRVVKLHGEENEIVHPTLLAHGRDRLFRKERHIAEAHKRVRIARAEVGHRSHQRVTGPELRFLKRKDQVVALVVT